jgi:hypothetical protein
LASLLRAVIGFFAMTTVALLAAGIWGDDWSMFGALLFVIALPLVLLATLPLPDFRWESVLASAGGLAFGMPVGLFVTFDSEDSGRDLLWIAATLYVGSGLVVYGGAGMALKGAYHLVKAGRRA